MKSINIFCYGHNSNIEQFKKRIPGARLLGTATLRGWRLELEHFANITRDKNSNVQGVVFTIPHSELQTLDKDEAYHIHYTRAQVKVELNDTILSAIAYVMTKKYHNDPLPKSKELPTAKYIHWIAKGYRENNINLKQLISALEKRIAEEKLNE